MATSRLFSLSRKAIDGLKTKVDPTYTLCRPLSKEARVGIDAEERQVEHLNPFASVDTVDKKIFLEELKVPTKRSFNLAAYVNQSKTLQEFIKLGVSLYDIENTNPNAARYLVHLDFEQDCQKHIRFLVDNGLKPRNLGRFISEYPLIFKEDLEDLQIRINYLESKGFSNRSIAQALNKSAVILAKKTKTLDYKLGELQIEFRLHADVIRSMVTLHPQVIALPVGQYKLVNFTLREEFGFTNSEIAKILRIQPHVIDILRPILIERIDLIHNTIGLSHATIARYPKLITGPRFEIKNRFLYLSKLKRNQFDPTKPLYVPPPALFKISDEEFCLKYAKTDLDDYKLFLRSM